MVLSGQIAKRTREGERRVGKSISSVSKLYFYLFIQLFIYLLHFISFKFVKVHHVVNTCRLLDSNYYYT